VLLTWPVARGLGRDIPGDLGDPVFSCWIMGRNAARLGEAVVGGPLALRGLWDAGIFHPEPLTLAYSEHFLAQSVPLVPVLALTGNPILGYNLVFLSTFVLSGLFAFLLLRDLTGSSGGAFVGGLVYAFSPYRVEQLSHVQILSSQWLPLVLLGLRRHLASGRRAPLALAAAALAVQGLSSGYLLLFFAPFVPLYALHEMAARGQLRDRRRWACLILAGAASVAATLPFLEPYRELRARGVLVRSRPEVESFSADVASFVTAPERLRLLGPVLRTHDGFEGALYPGLVPVLLVALALAAAVRRTWPAVAAPGPRHPRVVAAVAAVVGLYALGGLLVLAGLGRVVSAAVPLLGLRSVGRPVAVCVLGLAVLLATWPRARAFARGAWRSPLFFFAAAALLAFWSSLGPTVRSGGRAIGAPSVYGVLYRFVPGFDGLRVPARFAMVGTLFLAVLAGYGAALLAAHGRRGRALLGLATLAFLIESAAVPIGVNETARMAGLRRAPAPLHVGEKAPAVYHAARALAPPAVLLELPLGAPPYDVQHMFYALHHGHRLVNGHSGWEPPRYGGLRAVLARPWEDPARAWQAARDSGATHAIVHEEAWRLGEGPRATAWLLKSGARLLWRGGGDVLVALP
jgi:hypothetical protein